jgi:hypothetical protein
MVCRSGKSQSSLQSSEIMSSESEQPGSRTSEVEVTNISRHGFWLFLRGRELFLSFEDFPWFAEAPVSKITQVEWPSEDHLYWPALDIDLSVRSIEHPEEFPLKFASPN